MKHKLTISILKSERRFPEYYFVLYLITRVFFLIVMSTVSVLPYFTYDDLNIYSKVVISDYSNDYFLLRQIFINISCYLNSIWGGVILNGVRVLNILIYYEVIKEAALLCDSYRFDRQITKKICLTLILLPQLIIVSCSMVKDVFLMYLVLRSIRGAIYFLENKTQNYVWLVIVLILLYYSRFGLIEILAAVLTINYIMRSKHKVLCFAIIGVIIAFATYTVLSNADYTYLMDQKFEAFLKNKSTGIGLMNYLRISEFAEIYKIIFALPYMLALGVPDLRQISGSEILWMNVIGFFSFITLYLIPAFYAYIYEIVKRKNRNEILTLCYFSIYHVIVAINSPSLSRYMLCVYPIFIIFSVKKLAEHRVRMYLICATFSLLYIAYLVYQIFGR